MTDKKDEEGEIDATKPFTPAETVELTSKFKTPDTMVGQMLDNRFLIKKDLTEGGADAGGIGLVYLAQDSKLLNRQVVVKILQKAAIENPDILRKFQHEKEALIRLDHPNIVRILDSGTLSDGNPFMVMEYIAGYSLRRTLSERKPLSLGFCAHVIESVTSALAAAHAEKILHRDIKPENIMITPQPGGDVERVRVIDFGIARLENPELAPTTEIERAIGTVKYMPPEQLLGKLNQTSAADIYSVAIVAYEMLMGEQPFKPRSIAEMYELQKTVETFLPGQFRINIPEEVRSLLLQALSFNPSDRPQDVQKFGRDLSNLLRQANLANPQPEDEKYDKTGKGIVISLAKTETQSVPVGTMSSSKPDDSLSVATEFKNSANPAMQVAAEKSKLPIYVGIGLLILVGVGSLLGYTVWKMSNSDPVTSNVNIPTNTGNVNTANVPSRQLAYFLNVQKMRDGKPYEQPFRSSGQEVFESGYKFTMAFQSDAEGFVYVFNESKDPQLKTTYYILYPTPKNNNGSMPLPAKQQIETSSSTFTDDPGTEVMWFIWTANKNDILEATKEWAFNNVGKIESDTVVHKQLSDFLQKYRDQKNEVQKDTANKQTLIKGTGDIIAQRIELEHR
jgi:eukaryotic-like serine/threonine-protein kinase